MTKDQIKEATGGRQMSCRVKTPFPLLLFLDRLSVRSSAGEETDPEKDARKNSEGDQR